MSGRATGKRGTGAAASPPATKKTRVQWSPVTTPTPTAPKPKKQYTENLVHLQKALTKTMMVAVRQLEKKVLKEMRLSLAGGDLTDDSMEAVVARLTPVLEDRFGQRLEKLEASEQTILHAFEDLSKEVRDWPGAAVAAAAPPAQMTQQQIRSKGLYTSLQNMKDNERSMRNLVDR